MSMHNIIDDHTWPRRGEKKATEFDNSNVSYVMLIGYAVEARLSSSQWDLLAKQKAVEYIIWIWSFGYGRIPSSKWLSRVHVLSPFYLFFLFYDLFIIHL